MKPLARSLLDGLGPAPKSGVAWEVVQDSSLAGGGAAPDVRIATLCLALTHPFQDATALVARLRGGIPPIVGRIQDDRVLLDLRTLLPQDLPDVVRQVRSLA
jgi:L-seryl-tRNA(Ser) seleniumtransferase